MNHKSNESIIRNNNAVVKDIQIKYIVAYLFMKEIHTEKCRG